MYERQNMGEKKLEIIEVKSSPTVGKVMGVYLKTVVNGGQNLSRPHAVIYRHHVVTCVGGIKLS
jgi:hypothetical protein